MAYPTIDKPYGFKPINLIGGQVFAGSTRVGFSPLLAKPLLP